MAARRRMVVLKKKLHNEIGYSLRRYESALGSRRGSVQFKTRQLLWSLHVDIGEQNDCIEWKRCRRGDNEEKPLLLPAPPGLEMSVASECASIDDSSDTESIVETPRAAHIPSPAYYTSLAILPSTFVKACRTTFYMVCRNRRVESAGL